jgi:hypothetical protein
LESAFICPYESFYTKENGEADLATFTSPFPLPMETTIPMMEMMSEFGFNQIHCSIAVEEEIIQHVSATLNQFQEVCANEYSLQWFPEDQQVSSLFYSSDSLQI